MCAPSTIQKKSSGSAVMRAVVAKSLGYFSNVQFIEFVSLTQL
jgi:hypothetical protein